MLWKDYRPIHPLFTHMGDNFLGHGDILTGLTAAMIAQGFEPFDAACLSVHLHGLAGDLAAAELGEVSLMASDLLDFLPAATKDAVG